MSSVDIDGSALGSALQSILLCSDIVPGSDLSYEICKLLYLFHPLGQKMTQTPVKMAQFKPRKISVGDGPEEELVKQFEKQWKEDQVDHTICWTATVARIYGISSLALLQEDVDSSQPLDLDTLADKSISFNVFDPLNTAGSLVLNQNPNAMDFLKHGDIAVQGQRYHRSRTVVLLNEQPVYIAYMPAAFGFVGPSVYQRALYPMKTFIQTMLADDMVSRKVGLIIATLKMASSVVNAVMRAAAATKRAILKLGATDNVLSIAEGESISSLDLTNIDGPLEAARKHAVENTASACDMPASILKHESYAEGFGEGTEDAKAVAAYLDGIRTWMDRLYAFMDMVTQRRAWNKKFYKVIQEKYPESYGKKPYEQAFYEWSNSFTAEWPPLIQEPESEKVRVADTKLKACIALAQVLLPEMDPENKVAVIKFIEDTTNNMQEWFPVPLELDYDALKEYTPPEQQEQEEPAAPPPFSARDSVAAFLSSKDAGDLPHRVAKIEDWARRQRK